MTISSAMSSKPSQFPPASSGALDALRRLTPVEFVMRASTEALAVGIVASPGLAFFYALDGAAAARWPRVRSGLAAPPSPSTFPRLLVASASYSASCTVRTLVWLVAAAGGAAALREAASVGPRHQDDAAGASDMRPHVCGVIAGATAAGVLTETWAHVMGRTRWGAYVIMGGLAGACLPGFFARVGPGVQRRVARAREMLG